MADEHSILDDLFHGCALAAFVEQARHEGGWPEEEATRRRAFQMYEEELAARGKALTTATKRATVEA